MKQKIIVIGNGMVGHRFCEKMAERNFSTNYSITVFGEENNIAYDRVHLSEFFNSNDSSALSLSTAKWYSENSITLRPGLAIKSIDYNKKFVTDDSGQTHTFDKLVLAMGSFPFVPQIAGIETEGVFVYRTIEDLKKIKTYATSAKKGAIIGGGLLGLEAAKALRDLNIETHVVEFADRLMPRQLDVPAADLLKNSIEDLAVRVHLSKTTKKIESREGKVAAMHFEDGQILSVDMIIVSAGIRPRDELAGDELEKEERGGIKVDDFLCTSQPDVYAIGEVASYRRMIYGLVAPGYDMADVLAANLMKEKKLFLGADSSTKLKLIGIDVASFGDAFAYTENSRSISLIDHHKGVYKRINITEDGKYLIGGILVGDASDYSMLLQTMKNELPLPASPQSLLDSGASADRPQVPDSAIICSCNGVTKGEILNAVRDNEITDIASLKTCTNAGTGCGGCSPELSNLITECMKAAGKSTKKVICEHFAYSRQELYEIIKIKELNSFSEILASHGQGYGCEVCKPAVASILASLYNEHIVNHHNIQDTNDRFLANIQKNGTYSIVPRIAGGEITSDKLIILGEVAKQYNLYVKITGGQRIDLFGAQLNDLPKIWQTLIEAGFESGHAYAKGLRTVKSCVGSTWCRYGVQDSVSFAIKVEERYKGLRAPHKIKGAVTGCLRQCAEVDNKDFGMIATEKGYNLYVAGNGGAKPQSAKLLASDIDEETCLKYIDRFLIYYIQTAPPLTRTAAWFNALEGGMQHLQEVIIEDKLGIASELDAQMQKLVDAYHCEWREVVNDAEKRAKFQHFANDTESDDTIEFINERGQLVPKSQVLEGVK